MHNVRIQRGIEVLQLALSLALGGQKDWHHTHMHPRVLMARLADTAVIRSQ